MVHEIVNEYRRRRAGQRQNSVVWAKGSESDRARDVVFAWILIGAFRFKIAIKQSAPTDDSIAPSCRNAIDRTVPILPIKVFLAGICSN